MRSPFCIFAAFVLLASCVLLTACGVSPAVAALNAVTAAAEAVVPILTSDPAVIGCVDNTATAAQQAGVELQSTDSTAVKSQKILAMFANTGCLRLTGLSPRAQALISALVAATNVFLQSVAPPMLQARTVSGAPTPEVRLSRAERSRIGQDNKRLAAVIMACQRAKSR